MSEKQIIPTYVRDDKEYVSFQELTKLIENGEYLSLTELWAKSLKEKSKKADDELEKAQEKFHNAIENEQLSNSAAIINIITMLESGDFTKVEINNKITTQLRILDIMVMLFNEEQKNCDIVRTKYGLPKEKCDRRKALLEKTINAVLYEEKNLESLML